MVGAPMALHRSGSTTFGGAARLRNRLTVVAGVLLAVWLMASTQLSVYRNVVHSGGAWEKKRMPRVIGPNATCSEVRCCAASAP